MGRSPAKSRQNPMVRSEIFAFLAHHPNSETSLRVAPEPDRAGRGRNVRLHAGGESNEADFRAAISPSAVAKT
jgi:hypothetical protein